MKQLKFLIAICSVILLCSFVPAEWINFESAAGKFKLAFPRKPESSVQQLDNPDYQVTINMFIYDASKFKDDNSVYMAMYCDYPDTLVNSDFKEELVDTILKGSINGMARKMDGSIISMSNITYKDFPGKKVKMSVQSGKGFAYVRVFLVHNRLYMTGVLCELLKDHNISIDKFFNSFVLTDLK